MNAPKITSAVLMAGSLFLAGCYTEFALVDSDAAETPDAPVYIDQPVILPYIPPPVPFDPFPFSPPVGGVTTPGTNPGGGTTTPKRDTGKQRVPPPTVSTPRPAAPPSRSGGSTQPAPAPSAPSRAPESRPATGGTGRR